MLNIFQDFVTKELNPKQKKIAAIYSYLFFISMIIAIIILFTYYAFEETNITEIQKNPSFQTYTSMNERCTPICECNNIAAQINDIIHPINITTDSFCITAKAKQLLCANNITIPGSVFNDRSCLETQAGAILNGGAVLCDIGIQMRNKLIASWKLETIVSNNLLTEQTLNKRIEATKSQILASLNTATMGIIKGSTAVSTIDKPVIATFDAIEYDVKKQALWPDASAISYPQLGWSINDNNHIAYSIWNDKNGVNKTCSCGTGWNCKIDVNIPSDPTYIAQRTCSLFETIMNNKLLVWSYEEWFKEAMGLLLQTTDDIPQSFIDNIYSTNIILWEKTSTYYNHTMEEAFEDGFIAKDSFKVIADMNSYFNNCNPKQCICITRGKRGFIDILVVLFGLIGGVNTVLKAIISKIHSFHAGKSENVDENMNQQIAISNIGKNNTETNNAEPTDAGFTL